MSSRCKETPEDTDVHFCGNPLHDIPLGIMAVMAQPELALPAKVLSSRWLTALRSGKTDLAPRVLPSNEADHSPERLVSK